MLIVIARHVQEKEAINEMGNNSPEGLNAQAVPSENPPTGSFVNAIQYIFWNLTESQQSRWHLVEERVTNAVALAIKQYSSL